jgi:hypothetical protein
MVKKIDRKNKQLNLNNRRYYSVTGLFLNMVFVL